MTASVDREQASRMSIRVVTGEISPVGAATRLVIPTAAQPRWPPFERVAERIATSRRSFPAHRHEGVEVLTYVIEGSALNQVGSAPPQSLSAGSVSLITAPTPIDHAANPGEGHSVRWFAAVVRLPPHASASVRVQQSVARGAGASGDEPLVRPLVGPGTGLVSSAGIECAAVSLSEGRTSFHKVGSGRVALCYALGGRGSVDGHSIEGGEAALIEDAAGIALHGEPTLRALFVSAPRPERS